MQKKLRFWVWIAAFATVIGCQQGGTNLHSSKDESALVRTAIREAEDAGLKLSVTTGSSTPGSGTSLVLQAITEFEAGSKIDNDELDRRAGGGVRLTKLPWVRFIASEESLKSYVPALKTMSKAVKSGPVTLQGNPQDADEFSRHRTNITTITNIAKTFGLRGADRAQKGNTALALADLADAFAANDLSLVDKSVASSIQRCEIEVFLIRMVCRSLYQPKLTPKYLDEVRKIVAISRSKRNFNDFYNEDVARTWSSVLDSAPDSPQLQASLLKFWIEAKAALTASTSLTEAYAAASALESHQDLKTRPEADAVRDAVPSLKQAVSQMRRREAFYAALEGLLSVLDYKLKNGKFPSGRDVPAKVIDPYGGNQIRWFTQDGLVVAYSFGPDGQDDGGLKMAVPRNYIKDDVPAFMLQYGYAEIPKK